MLVRLRNTGFIESEAIDNLGEIPSALTKRVRLVYVGEFESMDGPVKVTEEHLQNVANSYNGKLAKLKRLATGTVPVGNLPPVQLDHTRSARDTVGRLENSDLVIEDWTDEDGQTRKALYGNVRFLGRENVEKVLDGRWSTLSIGADFEKGKLDELSVTPFPAAEGASVLSRKQQDQSHETNKESIMKLALYQRLRKHLKKKMSDEEVDKKMNKLAEDDDEEELKKLAEEADEEEKKELEGKDDEEEKKKLAEEDEKKKDEMKKKMSAAKTKLTQLSSDFRSKREAAQLAAKAAAIGSRLSAIRSTGRITPAEVKKIDIKQLASKSQEAIDAVLKSYEDRQPVILVGQLGSMKPMSLKDVQKVEKHVRLSQLEIETRKNMSLLRNTVPSKLAEGEKEEEGAPDTVNIHVDTDPHTDMAAMENDYTEMCNMMDGGKIQEVKERLKGWMERMKKMGAYGMAEPTMHEQSMSQLAALQSDLAMLSAKFEEAMGLAESLASGE